MKLLKVFLSLKTTVVCLSLLFILVIWGTVFQVENGLYQAQQKFFYSWIIMIAGLIPFPGGKLVMYLLFANLMASLIFHFRMGWRMVGILLIHLGVLLMLVGGWFTHLTGMESYLTLAEGEGSNLSVSYREWEVSVWKGNGELREVVAFDASAFEAGKVFKDEESGITLEVESFNGNVSAFTGGAVTNAPYSPSNISRLEEIPLDNDPQVNIPGGVFKLSEGDHSHRILLYGGDLAPAKLHDGPDGTRITLRRLRNPLPIFVQLKDFKREYHPNSTIPSAYSSLIEVSTSMDSQRDVIIEMNKPFRHNGYTFYQASFGQDAQGGELSTFAVTLNYGRLLPYYATGVSVVGLIIHFLMLLVQTQKGRAKS